MLATVIITALVTALIMAAYMDVRINQEADAAYNRGRQVGMQIAEQERRPAVHSRRVEGPHDIHPDGATCDRCRRFRGCFSDGFTFYGKRSCTFSPSKFDPSSPQSALDQMAPAQKGD